MVWTYYAPDTNAKDHVRFLVGDTNANEPICQDEEIAGALVMHGSNILKAAVAVSESIAIRFASMADESYGGYSGRFAERAKSYHDLSKRLRIQAYGSAMPIVAAMPYAGGISVSDKDSQYSDSDRVKSAFLPHQFDYTASEADE